MSRLSLVGLLVAGDIVPQILWIAQTEELCEQAVQTWSEVWRALGPNEPLTISRIWGGRRVAPTHASAHVVVGTIQTMQKVADRGDQGLLWLELDAVYAEHPDLRPSEVEVEATIERNRRQPGAA